VVHQANAGNSTQLTDAAASITHQFPQTWDSCKLPFYFREKNGKKMERFPIVFSWGEKR
jgi:hypothetical protein